MVTTVTKIEEELKMSNLKKTMELMDASTFHNILGLKITDFNKKFLKGLSKIEESGEKINPLYYKEVKDFSDKINEKLSVTDFDTYNKIISYISMNDILLDKGIETSDIDCLTGAFFGLEANLNALKIFKE